MPDNAPHNALSAACASGDPIIGRPALTAENVRSLSRNGVIAIPRAGRTPERWRVNGALKTWKRDAGRFRLPLKHGLYAYAEISNDNLALWQSHGAYIETA